MSLGATQDRVVLSPGQEAAVTLIESKFEEGGVVFVTGKAGTGKSTVLRELRSRGYKLLVTAPTGLAAVNVQGATIHRTFKLKTGVLIPKMARPLDKWDAETIRRAHAIVIDEISMVRADVLDSISECLKRTLNSHLPFGGKLMVFFGDMWQLEPVVTDQDKEWIKKWYPRSSFWFDSKVIDEISQGSLFTGTDRFQRCELTDVFRQSDPEIVDALNLIRVGDPAGIALINKLAGRRQQEGSVSLCFTNSHTEGINMMELGKLDGYEKRYSAVVEGDFKESDSPVPFELILKVGAQVMVTRNMMGGIVNGAVGTITDLPPTGGPVVELRSGEIVQLEPAMWDKSEYEADKDDEENIKSTIKGSVTQYPLKLAWAITVHKSQGQTLEKAHLALERRAFSHGQLYVALSRVKSKEGLSVARDLNVKDIVVNPRVKEWASPPVKGLNWDALENL